MTFGKTHSSKMVMVLAALGTIAVPRVWGQAHGGGRKVLAVVPMVGTGTYQDPQRPMFAPGPGEEGKAEALSYSAMLSDDGLFAIVEFHAARPSIVSLRKLDEVAESKHPEVKAFDRSKHTKEEVEREIRKFKKDFDVEQLAGVKKQGGN
ncbi:MAG: hypothetical protein HY858_01650 [Candidatus Solibacter usitatus]|nr:hypothetical protein [Candidatus Solibacter usitatus]